MEVKLLGIEGAVEDPDSIISLRASSLRRQGKPQVGVSLNFPMSLREATPFKIDVLRAVGVGHAMVPPEGGDLNVDIIPPSEQLEASPKSLSLRVTSMPQLCGRSRQELKTGSSGLGTADQDVSGQSQQGDQASSAAMGKEPTATDPMEMLQIGSGATVQARQYFDDHNVMRVVQALLEALIRDQPAEPFEFIAAFMDSLSEGRRRVVQESPSEVAGKTREEQEDMVARKSASAFGCQEWVCAFDAADTSRAGHISPDAFCTAIQAVHPNLSLAQAQALFNGVAPAGSSGINLSGFCGAATAVSEGLAMAAEVAGMSAEDFAELGREANET